MRPANSPSFGQQPREPWLQRACLVCALCLIKAGFRRAKPGVFPPKRLRGSLDQWGRNNVPLQKQKRRLCSEGLRLQSSPPANTSQEMGFRKVLPRLQTSLTAGNLFKVEGIRSLRNKEGVSTRRRPRARAGRRRGAGGVFMAFHLQAPAQDKGEGSSTRAKRFSTTPKWPFARGKNEIE